MSIYKGLEIIMLGQYPAVKMNHHKANADGLVYIHVLVAEEILGRKLSKDECVHHINFDKSDYSKNNLMIFASNGEHIRFHNALKYQTPYCLLCKNNVFYCITGESYIDEIFAIHTSMTKISAIYRHKCPLCGALISSHAKLCGSCNKKERKAKALISKEDVLTENKNGLTCAQIATKYGVSATLVRRYLKETGVYQYPYPIIPDRSFLVDLLCKMNISQVAKTLNVSKDSVQTWIKKHCIKITPTMYLCVETNILYATKQDAVRDVIIKDKYNVRSEATKLAHAIADNREYQGFHWKEIPHHAS